MPKNKDALTRYLLIDQRLNNKQLPPPSLAELTDYVADKMDLSISESTIQKDILALRRDLNLGYDAPIIYDQGARGYKYEYDYSINQLPIDENDLHGISMALSILDKYKDLPAIKNMEDLLLSLGQKVSIQKESLEQDGVITYDSNKYIGIEYLSSILDSIQNRKVIYIDYRRFQSEEVKQHKVHPYFIKEFENRMYLIGLDVNPKKLPLILTFALDRCVDVTPTTENYNETIPDRDQFFKHLYGVGNANEAPEKIVLECDPLQYDYLVSNPVHATQVAEIKDGRYYITLQVVINYELRSRILGLGKSVKVLEPQRLKKEIKSIAQDIYEQY